MSSMAENTKLKGYFRVFRQATHNVSQLLVSVRSENRLCYTL
jgi:hypothetical protein